MSDRYFKTAAVGALAVADSDSNVIYAGMGEACIRGNVIHGDGVYGSTDGATWTPKSIAAFPQQFYTGEWPLLLDLSARPDVKFVRAHWEVNRWGRGTETPMFEFGVTMKEVPPEILRDATAEARTLA